MSTVSLQLKQKLLRIAQSGCYVEFAPKESQQYHHELEHFLNAWGSSIPTTQLLDLYEMFVILLLMTCHDYQAQQTLAKIKDYLKYSASFLQRYKLLQSLFHEAKGDRQTAVDVLGSNQDEDRLMRRLTTFARTDGPEAYVAELTKFLNLLPSDSMVWTELGHAYHQQGHYTAAVFAFQEVLMLDPYAYSIYHQVALNYYHDFLVSWTQHSSDSQGRVLELLEKLENATNNYLRCLELCPVYAKAWLGVYKCVTHEFGAQLTPALKDLKKAQAWRSDCNKLRGVSAAKFMELTGIKIQDKTDLSISN